jgi:hypothetical protein
MSSEADSVGVQCAVDGEYDAGAGSATTVQRQWVRVGAAVTDVVRRSELAKSEMVDVLRSMFAYSLGIVRKERVFDV